MAAPPWDKAGHIGLRFGCIEFVNVKKPARPIPMAIPSIRSGPDACCILLFI